MKCCDIEAGKLRHKVQIQRRDKVPDGGGGWTVDWVKVMDTWAWIKPLSGSEGIVGMQLQAQISHDIIMKYKPGLTAADRVEFQGRFFNIQSVINVDERNQWTQLRVMEGVAQ